MSFTDNLSPTQADLVKSLRSIGLTDEELQQYFKTEDNNGQNKEEKPIDKPIEKSIEDQIADKKAELQKLEDLEAIEKSNDDTLNQKVDTEEIVKSITAKVSKSNEKITTDIDALTNIVKGLTGMIGGLKENNEKLVKDNDDLKKSLTESVAILKKIAEQSPGLKSVGSFTNGFTPRFQNEIEKSEDGKEILSVSKQKNEISSRLVEKMNDSEFMKSFGEDIESFECSNVLSDRLQKAITDDLNIELKP